MTVFQEFNREASLARGIDPAVSERVWNAEGGLTEPARVGKFATGWSFWAVQLHYGGAGYEHFGTVAGMGNGFTKLTGWEPGDPLAWRDAMRYALNRVKTGGWGPWYGAAAVGVGQWDGIDRNHPWDANAEIWDYETRDQATLTYNPSQPPERQVQSWVCSIRATAWMLKSLGLPVDISALQDEMSPKYVTPDLGLLDGRGYGIAEVLKAHLSGDWDNRVHVFERISWDELRSLAGAGPIALGLHGAYHWINVSRKNGDDLDAPNPAPNYPAEGPIGDALTRAEFDRWGPASAVWINAADVPSPPPLPADPKDARIAELESEVARLNTALAGERTKLGVAAVDYVRGLRDLANAYEALKPTP